jgi:hypothetical protein
MSGGMRRFLVLAGTIAAVIVLITGVSFALTITQPVGNPFTVPDDGAGNPVPFTIVATGFTQFQQVFVQECDGVPPTAPHYSATDHCDLASGNSPAVADAAGTATFAADDANHRLNVFKGESPQSLFNCLGPDDPPMTQVNSLPDFHDCQVRVSAGTPGDTAAQAYFSIVLPDSPGDTTTSSSSTTSTSTSTTSTTSTTTTTTTTTTVPPTTTTTKPPPPPVPGKPGSVAARPGFTTSPWSGPIVVTYAAGVNHGPAVAKFTATCRSSNGGLTRAGVHVGATAAPIVVGDASLKRTYTCTVTATSSAGTSLPSVPSLPIVVGAPSRPGTPVATRIAAGRLRVTFPLLTGAQANGSALTTPKYTATCTSRNGGVARAAAGVGSGIVVLSLTPGRTYTCSVRAHNARGYSQASPLSAARVA